MKQFALRVKDHKDFDSIESLAKQETRSINGQINVLLKEALTNRKTK